MPFTKAGHDKIKVLLIVARKHIYKNRHENDESMWQDIVYLVNTMLDSCYDIPEAPYDAKRAKTEYGKLRRMDFMPGSFYNQWAYIRRGDYVLEQWIDSIEDNWSS